MGGGSWSPEVYKGYSHSVGLTDKHGKATAKSAKEIFTSNKINESLNPLNVKIRESRDSAEHPFSTAIAMLLDVTGSMNIVAKYIAQEALPKLMKEIYDRKPVTDPQVLFMGVDDLEAGGHLQVSQFESDIRIAEQLQLLWLENNGGGNDHESYSLPWFFLANHTAIDCFEKRNKKGYAISMGDELPNMDLNLASMNEILGYKPQSKHKTRIMTEDILEDVRKKYHVFHVITEEGSYARSNLSQVRGRWIDLLGEESVLSLPDYTKLSEVVISAIEISEGKDPDAVAKSWEDKKTVDIVAKVVKNVKRIVEI